MPALKERLLLAEVDTWPVKMQKTFHKMIKNGQTVVMAHMLTLRKGPEMGGNSDQRFNRVQRRYMSQMCEDQLSLYRDQAKSAGINITGKHLIPGIPVDDPRAWVSTVDEAKSSYQSLNLDADGVVKNKAVQVPPKSRPRLAADIVEDIYATKLREDEDLRVRVAEGKVNPRDLKSQIVEEHGKKSA